MRRPAWPQRGSQNKRGTQASGATGTLAIAESAKRSDVDRARRCVAPGPPLDFLVGGAGAGQVEAAADLVAVSFQHRCKISHLRACQRDATALPLHVFAIRQLRATFTAIHHDACDLCELGEKEVGREGRCGR